MTVQGTDVVILRTPQTLIQRPCVFVPVPLELLAHRVPRDAPRHLNARKTYGNRHSQ